MNQFSYDLPLHRLSTNNQSDIITFEFYFNVNCCPFSRGKFGVSN